MAGVMKRVEWQESEEQLHESYLVQSDVEQRKRVQALWLLRQGYTETQTARLVGVGRRTVVRWVSWYRDGGLEEVTRRVPGHGAVGATAWLTPQQLDELVAHTSTGALHKG